MDWEETRVWIAEPPSEDAYESFALFASGALAASSTWQRTAVATPPPLNTALEHFFLHLVMNELREDPGTSPVLVAHNAGGWSEQQRRQVADILLNKVFPMRRQPLTMSL